MLMVCNFDMIYDICSLSDQIGTSLLPIYTCPVGQV